MPPAPLLWLLAGDLRFDDVSLRYFPGGPLALRHVNFHVQSCEKVGCCQMCGIAVTTGSPAEPTVPQWRQQMAHLHHKPCIATQLRPS